jgi:hypothetical protein
MSDADRDTARSPSDRPGLRHLSRTQDALLERLAAAIERDYDDAHDSIARHPEQRRTEIVQRLLAEEPVGFAELAELDYELRACWHLGMIATGSGPQAALRCVKPHLGWKFLQVSQGDTVWVWLGASRKFEGGQVERLLSANAATWGSLALGGVWSGLDGWRQTHQEAKGALPLALQRPGKIARYADGPLLAAALENETLAMWLREFLTPLRSRHDGGLTLLETLRAYIDADCNSSSAASMLNVRRQTVTSRLRIVQELLGRELRTCLAALDTALRLADLAVDDYDRTSSLNTTGQCGRFNQPH